MERYTKTRLLKENPMHHVFDRWYSVHITPHPPAAEAWAAISAEKSGGSH